MFGLSLFFFQKEVLSDLVGKRGEYVNKGLGSNKNIE
jgi:hypothetical protein